MARTMLAFLTLSLLAAGCGKPDGHPDTTRRAAAFDPTAFGPREAPPGAELPPLEVVDYAPRGEEVGTRNVGQVRVRFNRAVRPMTSAAEQTAPGLLTVRDEGGPVEGEAYFKTPNLLVFETKASLPPAHRYTVTLSGDVTTMDGSSLPADRTWTFQTDRPSIDLVEPATGGDQVDTRAPLFLRTTLDTRVEDLRGHLRLRTTDGPVGLTIRQATEEEQASIWAAGLERVFRVDADAAFPVDTEVTLEITPGWTSTAGPLAAAEPYQATFTTHPRLTVEEFGCETSPCPLQRLEVQLSTTVSEDQSKRIRVRPRPAKLQVAPAWSSSFGMSGEYSETRSFWIDGRFEPGVDYEIVVDGRLEDVFGQRLGTTRRHSVRFEMPPPQLYLTQRRGTVRDDGEAHVGISSRHIRKVRVRAARVPVRRYRELYLTNHLRHDRLPPLDELGVVTEKVVDVSLVGRTQWGSTPIEFADLVGNWRGPVAIEVRAETMAKGYRGAAPGGDRGIFQFTSLAPHFVGSIPRSVIRVEDLATRKPAAKVALTLSDDTNDTPLGVTDGDGLAMVAGTSSAQFTGRHLLTARASDGESAVVDIGRRTRHTTWARPGERVQGRVVAERGVYQPGEKVWVVGWAALRTPHDPYGFTSLPDGTRATLELTDTAGTPLAEKTVDIHDGKFWAHLAIPRSARLGHARITASFANADGEASRSLGESVRIEEYRVPNFEVEALLDDDELVGDQKTKLEVRAHYFSGGPISFENLRVSRSCWQTRPPAPDGWIVGMPATTWGYGTMGIPVSSSAARATGRARVEVGAFGFSDGVMRRCTYSAVVQSASFQEEGASATAVVHPGDFYLGARADGDPIDIGANHRIELATFDHDGARIDRDATAKVVVTRTVHTPIWSERGRRRWISRYEEETEQWTTCTVKLRAGAGSCELTRLEEGTYRIDAQLTDHPEIRTRTTVSVTGDDRWGASREQPFISLQTPDTVLTPGEPFDIDIRTAEDVSGMVVVERFGIRDAVPFTSRRGVAEVSLTPNPSWARTMHFRAFAIDTSTGLPVLAVADGSVEVDASPRKLSVALNAPDTASIRQSIPIRVTVEADDGPVDGRVSLWAVDEAVLGLTNYHVPDVGRHFLAGNITGDLDSYEGLSSFLDVFDPQRYDPYRASGFGQGFGSGGGGMGMSGSGRGGGGSAASPRVNFETTPFFLGDAAVKDGVAEATFDLPDNLTAYRIIAVASSTLHDESTPMRFGHDARRLRVTAPLIARPALPRFTRPGDTPELGVIVDNQSGKAGTLAVEFELDGESLRWRKGVEPSATLKVSGVRKQHRVAFDARAVAPGTTQVMVSTTLTPDDGSGSLEDVVRVALRTDPEPTIVETVATYGNLADDAGLGMPVKLPKQARTNYGGIEVSVSSTLLGGLRDATRELVNYPYGCAEQTSSRLLPLVALSDLRHFVEAVEIPNGSTIDEFVDDGVARILSMQQNDGGFSYWPGTGPSNAYVSAYATWVLQLARTAGHDIPAARLEDALDYLTTVTEEPDEDWPDSVLYYHDLRRAIAVHALARAGRTPREAIDRLYQRREGLPVFARAFIAMAMYETSPQDSRLENLQRELTNAITEQPGSAHVVESPRYDLGEYFHSDLRSSAITLMALLKLQPDHPLNPKLARGLMEKRYRGAWRNTQENAYALVAMADYARAYEKVEPNFGVRVWTDHAVLLDDRWKGRSSRSRTGRLPMEQAMSLAAREPSGTLPVNIRRKGTGRAYYRMAMTYAPEASDVEAIARGIDVRREFRRRGKPATNRLPATVQAGEVLAIDVELHTKSLSRYVAVDIPLPAGFEGINLALGGPKALPMGGVRGWWVSHSEYHDDRIVLFADTLQPGTRRHTVYVRATTPGSFVFPPTTAKAMYTPEVFGRTDGGRTRVEK